MVKTEEALLLCTLCSFKSGLTDDLPGFVSGKAASNAKRYQDRGITVRQEALSVTGHLPKREFATVAESEAYFFTKECYSWTERNNGRNDPG